MNFRTLRDNYYWFIDLSTYYQTSTLSVDACLFITNLPIRLGNNYIADNFAYPLCKLLQLIIMLLIIYLLFLDLFIIYILIIKPECGILIAFRWQLITVNYLFDFDGINYLNRTLLTILSIYMYIYCVCN